MTLAHEADLDPTYISGIEQGRRNVTLVTMRTLAEALNVSPSVFFESVPPRDA